MNLHGPLGLPDPSAMPQTGQTVALVITALLAAASVAFAVAESRRRGDLLLVYTVVGTGLTVVADPLLAVLVGRAYPSIDQVTVVTTFGVDVPLFMALIYVGLLPLVAYVLLTHSRLGIGLGAFWTVWLGAVGACLVAELLTLWLTDGIWEYAGDQPFRIFDVPVLTGVTYVSAAVVVGGGVCLMERVLSPSLHWLALVAAPMLIVAGHTMGSLPLAISLNSTDNGLWLRLGALGTVGFALVIGYGVAAALRQPWVVDLPQPHALDHDLVQGPRRI